MHVLARFKGLNGEIRVLEDRATGVRLYEEGGVAQSRVRAGGETDVTYVRLMAEFLAGQANTLLLGCGGGALGTMLHRQGSRVTTVDVNPISFQLARTFFWMPAGIECVVADARVFACQPGRELGGIGIDVGGPRFCYEDVLTPALIARLRRALGSGGRIAVNLSLRSDDDPVPGRIADRLDAVGLEVWALTERESSDELNVVIVASAGKEQASVLARTAGRDWVLARLTGERRRRSPHRVPA